MIMCKNESMLVHSANAQESTGEQRRLNKDAYRAPRLVVIGTAVEIVQGSRQGSRVDGPFGTWPW
jgi:hypothetical protein